MHEYSLMEDVIESVTRDLSRRGVTQPGMVREMVLRVGGLDIHSEESFKQAFAMLVQGTVLATTALTLEIFPARMECPKCGFRGPCGDDLDGHDPTPVAECPRCGHVSMVQGGRGIEPIQLVLEDAQQPAMSTD